jgi:hypothetical protein
MSYRSSATSKPADRERREPHSILSRCPTGERVELARYVMSAGVRVIDRQRVLGVVRLVDVPANGCGRRFVIERGLTSMAELEAIVADYLQQAARWDAPPAEAVCLVDGIVEARLR